MIGSIIRSVVAVVLGLVVALLLVIGVEAMGAVLHPFPPDFDPADIEACKAHVARYPAGVLLLVVACWGFLTFASSWVATRLGSRRHMAHGIVVGLLLFAAVIANMLMLPYPLWFEALNLIVFPVGFLLGAWTAKSRPTRGVALAV